MRVRITITLDIDSQGWAREFGLDQAEVREDVKAYVENLVREQQVIQDQTLDPRTRNG